MMAILFSNKAFNFQLLSFCFDIRIWLVRSSELSYMKIGVLDIVVYTATHDT